jgi:hypothetical protein
MIQDLFKVLHTIIHRPSSMLEKGRYLAWEVDPKRAIFSEAFCLRWKAIKINSEPSTRILKGTDHGRILSK